MAAAEQDDTTTAAGGITGLDDPALIAERRRLREALGAFPGDASLLAAYERVDGEFMRRAASAWATPAPSA